MVKRVLHRRVSITGDMVEITFPEREVHKIKEPKYEKGKVVRKRMRELSPRDFKAVGKDRPGSKRG